jgi:hypothetical protein
VVAGAGGSDGFLGLFFSHSVSLSFFSFLVPTLRGCIQIANHSQTAFLKNSEKAQHGDQNTSSYKKNRPDVANQPCDKADFISQGFQFRLEFSNSRLSQSATIGKDKRRDAFITVIDSANMSGGNAILMNVNIFKLDLRYC